MADDLATRIPVMRLLNHLADREPSTRPVETPTTEPVEHTRPMLVDPGVQAAEAELSSAIDAMIVRARLRQDELHALIDGPATQIGALAAHGNALEAELQEVREKYLSLNTPEHAGRVQEFADLEEAIGHLEATRGLLGQ